MNPIDVYIKLITLLYRESLLQDESNTDNSKDLVKTILNLNRNKKWNNLEGEESNALTNLKKLILSFAEDLGSYDKEMLIESLSIILKEQPTTLEIAKNALNQEMSIAGLKNSIVALRKFCNNYYRDTNIENVILQAARDIRSNNLGDKTKQELANDLIVNLESLSMRTKGKDEGVVAELDIADENEVSNIFKTVKDQATGDIKLKTGWKQLNIMLQGGLKRGECVVVNALQHKYKSGFTQSIFMQIAMHNVPVLTDKNKKPLLIYISLEDNAVVFTEFMYRYLYYNEFDKIPDIANVSGKDVADYIKDKLTVNGYNIKMLRVNPSEWTYKHVINKVLEYEAEGYEVHALFIDYLGKLSTEGCINTGPTGTNYRDLWTRMYNFFSAKKILFLSPWQISTDGKALIRNGVPDANFVKEIVGKGYTELSKQIDQVVDLELYIHIARINRKPYLTVQRGKHRTPGILDEDKMYFMLPFPYHAPIKENLNDPDEPVDPMLNIETDNDGFDFA